MTDDLPIDDELEAILAARDASRLVRSRRTLFGLMRALARVRATMDDQREWLSAVTDEANLAWEHNAMNAKWLAESIEAIAPDFLLDGSKHVDVPGAGRIQYRSYADSMRIADPAAFMAALGADERALMVETKDVLRTGEAKAYAKAALEETGELLPGAEHVPEHTEATISTGGN